VRRQYWCQPRAHNSGCGKISVDQRALDDYVGRFVVRVLSDPEHSAAIEAALNAAQEQLGKLDAEIAECEELAEELAARLGRREITLARYDAAVKPLDRQLAELRAQREAVVAQPSRPLALVPSATSTAEMKRRWDTATTGQRRLLLRQALRGRVMLVKPLDPTAARVFDPARVVLED
jgi:hypothetical protein